MKRQHKQKALILSVIWIITAAVFLGGCGLRPRAQRTEDKRTVLRIGFADKLSSLNPYAVSGEAGECFVALAYDTLFSADAQTGEIAPSLCTEYEVTTSADGSRRWELTLRDDALWSDGGRVTADDVEFSLQSLKDFSAAYAKYAENIDTTGIAVRDKTHIVFISWTTDSETLECLCRLPILPRHIWNKLSYFQYGTAGVPADLNNGRRKIALLEPEAEQLVSSGMYTFAEKTENGCILYFNSAYSENVPKATAISLSFGVENGFEAVQSRKLDAYSGLTEAQYGREPEKSGLQLFQGTGNALYLLELNHYESGNPLLRQQTVRALLANSLPRREILLTLGGGMETAGFFPTKSPLYIEPGEELPVIWDAFSDKDNDDILDCNGKELSFSLIYSNTDKAWAKAAELLEKHCRLNGIELKTEALAPEMLQKRIEEHDFDIALTAMPTAHDPLSVFRCFYWNDGANAFTRTDAAARSVSPGWNETGYQNVEFDKQYEAYLADGSPEQARKLAELLYTDVAAVPIGFAPKIQCIGGAWKCLTSTDSGLLFDALTIRDQLGNLTTWRK